MFRINLLPKEVQERRRYEGWYRWVFIGAAAALFVVVALGVLFMVEAKASRDELQSTQEETAKLKVDVTNLRYFQQREQQLEARQQVAQGLLAGRVNLGKVANEISLVLPDEVWIDSLSLDEGNGLSITADTPRTSSQSNDVAYKSVAKTMVRLNELPELYDVWLGSATNAAWSSWDTAETSAQTTDTPVVTFQLSGKLMSSQARSSNASGTAGGTVSPAAAAQGAVNSANNASAGQ
jgi:Tfp pilus assembly protein PilN